MKHISKLIIALALVGCNQAEETESCNCYEVHENLEQVIVQGMPSNQWVMDYETPQQLEPCVNASDYVYTSNGTKRYKKICQ